VLSVETTSPDRLSSFVFAVPIGAGINHDPPTCPSRSWQYPTAGGYGMSIWQYLQLDLNELAAGDSEVDALNAVGKNGWELVTITSHKIAYLKREAPLSAERSIAERIKQRDRS
jgi:hypothetical protein